MERNNVLLQDHGPAAVFPGRQKKGLYVKANDGISLNIYEGETVGPRPASPGATSPRSDARCKSSTVRPTARNDVLWCVP